MSKSAYTISTSLAMQLSFLAKLLEAYKMERLKPFGSSGLYNKVKDTYEASIPVPTRFHLQHFLDGGLIMVGNHVI